MLYKGRTSVATGDGGTTVERTEAEWAYETVSGVESTVFFHVCSRRHTTCTHGGYQVPAQVHQRPGIIRRRQQAAHTTGRVAETAFEHRRRRRTPAHLQDAKKNEHAF